MLENYARIRDYPVLPRLAMGKVENFFADLPKACRPSPTMCTWNYIVER